MNFPLHFDPIIYPLWRRRMPAIARAALMPFLKRSLATDADMTPPADAEAMATVLHGWRLFRDDTPAEIRKLVEQSTPRLELVNEHAKPAPYDGSPVHLPAQWEPIERVLISWGVLYPWVWPMFAAMLRAITPVAALDIVLPDVLWAHAVHAYLLRNGITALDGVRFVILPTDDIWIRDYGPLSGRTAAGTPVLVDMVYDPLPNYPQENDDAFSTHYAAHRHMALAHLPLHFEGGNLWSDGRGTLITTDHVLASNRRNQNKPMAKDDLLAALRAVLHIDKLIVTPRMRFEETGHIDLVMKLVNETTVFVSAPDRSSGNALRTAEQLLKRDTNAHGQPYDVRLLPTPPLYLNWLVYPIRRSYTNALTVNGRVLVPTYGLATDDAALRAYEEAMPGHTVVAIDSRWGINGGGAVHCMTREIFGLANAAL